MDKRTLAEYYKFRKYKTPNEEEALLFLLSEVGELCDAARADHGNKFSKETLDILADFSNLGLMADTLVSGNDAWVRNGDRHKKSDIKDEVADINMMLHRFCFSAGIPSPDDCLTKKMQKKGFSQKSD